MKRRSFLAILGLSPLAPVAVKAEETPGRIRSPNAEEMQWVIGEVERLNLVSPSELQKLRVADARRELNWGKPQGKEVG